MLPRRWLVCDPNPRSYKSARQSMMSTNNPYETKVCLEGRAHGSRRARSNQQVVNDRRWKSAQPIRFQWPSYRSYSCPACSFGEGNRNCLARSLEHTAHSCPCIRASKHPVTSTELNLDASDRLSYPNLSLSSFAISSESPSSLHSLSTSIKGAVWKPTLSPTPSQNDPANEDLAQGEIFRSPHGFHIPRSKLEGALNSRPGSEASYWQYSLYEGPEGGEQKVKLHYCKNKESSEMVSQMFLHEEIIGFDIEWRAQAKSTHGIRSNVSLIQLACEERVALFHIARYPGPETVENLVAPTLKQILESPNIIKAGVAIKNDSTRLRNYLDIHCQSLFELSYLHKLVQYRSGNIDKVDRRNVKLAEQVQEHLKLPLLKGEVQISDWGRDLDYQQTKYAASDSYAAFQLFHVLEGKRKAFDPVPPRPAYAELNLAIMVGDEGQSQQSEEHYEDEDDSSSAHSVSSSDISMEELAHEYFHISLKDTTQAKPRANKNLSNEIQCPRSTLALSKEESELESKNNGLPAKATVPSELEIANQFVASFEPSGNRQVAPQALRAYSLWYKQGLSIPEVAAKLRTPPLQESSVISYLCDAIGIGNLRCEPKMILELSSKYNWRPFIKAHRNLFDKARKDSRRAKMAEA